MAMQPTHRVRRRNGAVAPVSAQAAGFLGRLRPLGLAVLCIAAFECSQLVFRSANRPYWADASAQIACAGDAPADAAPAAHFVGHS